MAKKKPILEQMRANPAGDWTIAKVQKVCTEAGVEIRTPNGSSHYVLSSPLLRDSLAVPYKRPIKALYIKSLVSYIDAHYALKRGGKDD